MSEENEKTGSDDSQGDDQQAGSSDAQQSTHQTGPTFTESPDPLSGVKEATKNTLDSMEGKTVSMKVYVGSIIGVIVLMLLARCGG